MSFTPCRICAWFVGPVNGAYCENSSRFVVQLTSPPVIEIVSDDSRRSHRTRQPFRRGNSSGKTRKIGSENIACPYYISGGSPKRNDVFSGANKVVGQRPVVSGRYERAYTSAAGTVFIRVSDSSAERFFIIFSFDLTADGSPPPLDRPSSHERAPPDRPSLARRRWRNKTKEAKKILARYNCYRVAGNCGGTLCAFP